MESDVGAVDHMWLAGLDDAPGILVKTGRAYLFNWDIDNTTAADAHIQLFDAAALADVTLGTTVPDYVIHSTSNANVTQALSKPISFVLGLCVFSTTTSTGNTAAIQDVSLGFV
jgi:hypothetical protein